MKLRCFVILVFISVIFTVVEGEWDFEGGRDKNREGTRHSLQNLQPQNQLPPQNEPPPQPPLPNQPPPQPNQTTQDQTTQDQTTQNQTTQNQTTQNQTTQIQTQNQATQNQTTQNQTQPSVIFSDNKNQTGRRYAQNQNAENATISAIKQEAQTINIVIVVLGSLGASLLLVAIAIGVLYWKVRKQQKLLKKRQALSDSMVYNGEDRNTNDNINSGSGNGKGDDGGGVGNGEASINISDGITTSIVSEKSNIINSNPSSGVNNGVGIEVVGEYEASESQHIQVYNTQQQLSPPPTAPPAEDLIKDNKNNNDLNIDINSNNNLSAPPLTAPPAYTPTAPPIYALPHIPIDDSVRDMILYTDGNTYQQSNSSEMNNNNGVLHPPVVWYAAGPTSQTNTPTGDALYQQSNSTIIQPNPSSTTNLNSSFNLHENDDGNDRPTHQRQTI